MANLETRVQSLEMVHCKINAFTRSAFEAGTHSGRSMPSMPLPPLPAGRVETVAQETHADAEEEEDEPIDDDAMQPVSDSEDAGQITQNDRENHRWIGSSSTLSLLDSFSGQQLPNVGDHCLLACNHLQH